MALFFQKNKEKKYFFSGLPDFIPNPLTQTEFDQLKNAVVAFLESVGPAILTLVLIIGGFYIIFSQGNLEKRRFGEKVILFSLACIVLLFAVKYIIDFLKNLFLSAQ